MSDRHAVFAWAESGKIADVRGALNVAGVLPGARGWRAFLDALLLWSGAVADPKPADNVRNRMSDPASHAKAVAMAKTAAPKRPRTNSRLWP